MLIPLAELVKDKRVIIIGPGATVKDDCSSIDVDSYDLVCRLNVHWRLHDGDHKVLGKRTDIIYHCLNENQYTSADLKFWMDNNIKMVSRADIDYLGPVRKVVTFIKRNENVKYVPEIVPYEFYLDYKTKLGCNPSTGTLAIFHLLSMPLKSLSVAGFDFYQSLYLYRTDDKFLSIVHKMDHNPKKQLESFKREIAGFDKFIPIGALEKLLN